ncbi:MAG: PAS domain S-box protein [Planctomycetales bacterium]|nr:PAS domain S-box protein [Planctomycetales bacterium]
MSDDSELSIEVLQRYVLRERTARKEAERLLEERSRQLYQSNVELKRIARAREDEAQRTKAIVDTAAEGIVIFDELGTIESLNRAAAEIFDISIDAVIGKNICEYIPTATFCSRGQCHLSILESLTANAAAGEIVGIRADGVEIPLEVAVSEFMHDGKKTFTTLLRDLSRRRALEAQLSHAQKMESVGQLAAGIAHEINTPIQYVGDNTRFLKTSFESFEVLLQHVDDLLSKCIGVEAVQDIAQCIQDLSQELDLEFLRAEIPAAIDQTLQGAESVARIVTAMKEFSHPGGEELQEIDLNHAINSTLTVSRNEWKYCAELVTDFACDLPLVPCLPGELNQALLNLIINAAHAMAAKEGSPNGKLKVSTRTLGEYAEIQISDSGTGIPESIRSRVFDPFFTTKGVGKGTGQGLAIAYNVIVEKHHGKLTFESEIGVGTTFSIKIPLASTESALANTYGLGDITTTPLLNPSWSNTA